jgi:predicted Zn-ribbon and HTH transcriptional regulator
LAHPRCPTCNSARVYRDGLRRRSSGETAQRFLCRDCGYRFSKKKLKIIKTLPRKNSQRALNTSVDIFKNSQLCAVKEEAKKLGTATETKNVAGEKRQDVRGLVTQFMVYLEREGYCKDTRYPYWLGRLAKTRRQPTRP